MRRLVILTLLIFAITASCYATSPEIAVKIDKSEHGKAYVRTYSTEKLSNTVSYDLYTIEKVNGKWKKKMYIRSIELPKADRVRKGKYRYMSEPYVVTGLAYGHVYTLSPTGENCHYSKPFWKKPLRGY